MVGGAASTGTASNILLQGGSSDTGLGGSIKLSAGSSAVSGQAGEIVVALGGEQERFALGIPGACDQPGGSAEDASVACGVGSFGEGLQVSVFRRRSA